nr:GNAT family protein [uncultured Sellimonas sp.]
MRKRYATDRMILRLADPAFARMTAAFFAENRKIFERYEEKRPEEFYLPEFQEIWLEIQQEKAKKKEWFTYYLFEKRKPGTVIGTLSLSQIQYGSLCSGVIGYRISQSHQGLGLGTEAVREGTRIGFEELHLHRMEADVMPDNQASLRVLEKCGYEKEGYFREYLRINGKWEDHIHLASIRT